MNTSVEHLIEKALFVVTAMGCQYTPLICNAASVASTVDGRGTHLLFFFCRQYSFLLSSYSVLALPHPH